MTLDTAINSALSGLQANQSILSLIANNIANANTEGYSAQEPTLRAQVVGGQVVGVDIADISRRVDALLIGQIQDQAGEVGRTTVLRQMMEKLVFLFGQPGSNNDLNARVDSFFQGLSAMANTPNDSITQTLAVDSGDRLANFLANTATELFKLQFDADRQIDTSIDRINTLLTSLTRVNTSLGAADISGQNSNALLDERDSLLGELSQIIPISTQEDSAGRVNVFATVGNQEFTLLNSVGTNIRLAYTPAASSSTFSSNGTINPIQIEFLNAAGSVILTQTMVAGGTAGSVPDADLSGKLGALLSMRDVEIPGMVEVLDNIATVLVDRINAVHNKGVSFPPPSSLDGTLLVDTDTALSISGTSMFAVLNSDGTPVASPWSHLTENDGGTALMPPLVIDFDALGSSVTPELIAKEYNEYYNEIGNYVSLGPFGNIDIRGETATGSAPITSTTFNLEGMNISDGDATIVVNGFSSSNGATFGAIPAQMSSGYTVGAGERTFTSSTFTANFPGTDVYEISVDVTVTDSDGNVTNSVITFNFDNSQSPSNVQGERYAAASATVDGTIVSPSTVTSISEMSFVDANGVDVASGASGYMQITADRTNTGVGISELTSEVGSDDRGFSHYFGLNDFFIEQRALTSSTVLHQSLNMAARADIIASPGRIARGQLSLSQQPSDSASNPLYTYEIGSGSTSNTQAMIDALLSQQSFSAAGDFPALTTSFSDYAASITSLAALKTDDARANENQQNILADGLQQQREAFSGVNIDVELANSIRFQNAYSAAARVITIVNELFDILLELG